MFSRSHLDELVAMDARPAVSLYLPTHVAGREIRQDPIRLKNLLSSAAERLAAFVRGIAAEFGDVPLQDRTNERRHRVLRFADGEIDHRLAGRDIGDEIREAHKRRARLGGPC